MSLPRQVCELSFLSLSLSLFFSGDRSASPLSDLAAIPERGAGSMKWNKGKERERERERK